jgi:hypothetical protein
LALRVSERLLRLRHPTGSVGGLVVGVRLRLGEGPLSVDQLPLRRRDPVSGVSAGRRRLPGVFGRCRFLIAEGLHGVTDPEQGGAEDADPGGGGDPGDPDPGDRGGCCGGEGNDGGQDRPGDRAGEEHPPDERVQVRVRPDRVHINPGGGVQVVDPADLRLDDRQLR